MTAILERLSPDSPHRLVRPFMRQSWTNLTFLHWRIDPAALRPLVPAGLELDLCDGSAWIGLVPFFITGLTLPKAPEVPWLSHFAETNLRTYVADAGGRRGVWFFSLDAARLVAVAGARAGYALPYFWAKMRLESRGNQVAYRSTRRHGPPATTDIAIEIGDPVPEPSELEVFLTARFRLYVKRGARLLKADVEHQPWALQRARVLRLEESLTKAAGLPTSAGAPLTHFAARTDVLVARIQPV